MPSANSPPKEGAPSDHPATTPAAPKATTDTAAASSQPPPTLPPNVSIFPPPVSDPAVFSQVLFQSRVFTRLTISEASSASSPDHRSGFYQQVVDTLKKRPELMRREDPGFWLVHKNAVLVFDGSRGSGEEDEDAVVKDRHHEHVRSVCLALKDGDLSLSIAGCVFDAVDAVGAGFQVDRLSGGAVLVIDLMCGDDDEEDDEEGSDDEDEDFDLLAGGEVVV